MLVLKLVLVATSVLLASLVARRFGHAVGGTVAGLPVIAGPVIGFVLASEPLPQAQAIVLTTLVCLPAAVVHMVVFAHAATRWRAPVALLLANTLLAATAALLLGLPLPAWGVCLVALAAPALGRLALPRLRLSPGAVAFPRSELLWRIAAAVVMAAAILHAAAHLPPLVGGVLLAVPIAGNVLPCFTLPRFGPAATVALLAGFIRGLGGFAAFFVTLHLALQALSSGAAYALAWAAALAVAAVLALRNLRQRAPR